MKLPNFENWSNGELSKSTKGPAAKNDNSENPGFLIKS